MLMAKGLIPLLFDNCEFGEAVYLIGKIHVFDMYRAHLRNVAPSSKKIS
jgi:hypothetical protein